MWWCFFYKPFLSCLNDRRGRNRPIFRAIFSAEMCVVHGLVSCVIGHRGLPRLESPYDSCVPACGSAAVTAEELLLLVADSTAGIVVLTSAFFSVARGMKKRRIIARPPTTRDPERAALCHDG